MKLFMFILGIDSEQLSLKYKSCFTSIPFLYITSNIKLYSEGRRGMKQEKLISHFFTDKNHGTYDDIKVQIIDYCDANDQERREDTLEPNGLNLQGPPCSKQARNLKLK